MPQGRTAAAGALLASRYPPPDKRFSWRDGLPLPAAAFVMSPYADLTLSGTTMQTKHEVDPLLSREAFHARVTDYTAGHDAAVRA